MTRLIRLSNRLQAVADFVEKGASVADIGTDHGFLPVYLAQTGIADQITASDMSGGSLNAALRSAIKYDVEHKIDFVVAPGLSGVRMSDIDTVVIAGVGGETIASILEDVFWEEQSIRLILQPQTKIKSLQRYLSEYGYTVCETKVVQDRGRNYTIILADSPVCKVVI